MVKSKTEKMEAGNQNSNAYLKVEDTEQEKNANEAH